MFATSALIIVYRILSLLIALLAVYIIFRERGWQKQLFAAILFVPFMLRAVGVK